MKTGMQNLKRCNLEEPTSQDYGCSAIQKKRKVNEFYSRGGLAKQRDAENFSCCSGSWSTQPSSHCAGEVHSNSKSMELNAATTKPLDRVSESATLQPPVVRSSRSRPRILPSRFNDSVLDTWKHGAAIKIDDAFEDSDMGFVKQEKMNKCVETELGGLGFDDLDYEKRINSLKTVKTSVNGSRSSLVKTESNDNVTSRIGSEGVERKANGNGRKRKDVYKLEDFALGDIVWAKCGKRYPAWPAVVIDPILQAPKSVLSCCVPGAICVMFFGYSRNGKQRVMFSLISHLCM